MDLLCQTKDGDVIEQSHRKTMHIGNENLLEFNQRMKTQTVLRYDDNNKTFKIDSTSSNPRLKYLSNEFVIELNRFITLDRNADFDENFIKTKYVNGVEKDIDNLQQEIRRTHKLQEGGLTLQQKEEYLHWIEELTTLRKNSYPKVVLRNEKIIKDCINEINALCEDLSKELVRSK